MFTILSNIRNQANTRAHQTTLHNDRRQWRYMSWLETCTHVWRGKPGYGITTPS